MSVTTSPLERRWTHEPREHLQRFDPRKGQVVKAKPGPWWDEPDKVQWVDEATDMDCLMLRNRMGVWCGYVGLPPGHPWRGARSYDQIDATVHGGLTYGPEPCQEDAPEGHGICHVPFPGRPADVAWLGFDCGHGVDYLPALESIYEEAGLPQPSARLVGALGMDYELRDVYRDEAYVRGEVASLARQATDAARTRKRHGYVKQGRDEYRHRQKYLVSLLNRRDSLPDIEEHLLQMWLMDNRWRRW